MSVDGSKQPDPRVEISPERNHLFVVLRKPQMGEKLLFERAEVPFEILHVKIQ